MQTGHVTRNSLVVVSVAVPETRNPQAVNPLVMT
jgi:hypothetical protein